MRTSAISVAIGLAAALGTTGVGAPAAHAFSQAAFPLVSQGNRGVDVEAIQYLVQSHGHTIEVDAVFGSSTHSAVIAFQGKKGLSKDGKVGAKTWAALATKVRSGDKSSAVKALQTLLNKKRGSGLTVDGVFGAGTKAAVISFQKHAGISADGVVGETTWRNLAWHYAAPSWSNICDQDPDQNGKANWGTGSAIGQLEASAKDFSGTNQGKVALGDISHEHGGEIAGHSTHEKGVDVDIWPIRTDSAQCTAGRITWRSSTYDRNATRQLIKSIRAKAPGHISVIYFNDPELIKEGLSTSLINHDNHIHVRYR